MNKKEIEMKSKFLSLILRHKPELIDLSLDINGWANINEIVRKTKNFELTKENILEIVKKSDKKRFVVIADNIRANQGHSIKVDLGLKKRKPPRNLYHGTAEKFLDSILKSGLKKQLRNHVHLSSDIKTASKVGRRHGKLILLEVDSEKMFDDSLDFYISENGVWLTDFIKPKYLKIIKK